MDGWVVLGKGGVRNLSFAKKYPPSPHSPRLYFASTVSTTNRGATETPWRREAFRGVHHDWAHFWHPAPQGLGLPNDILPGSSLECARDQSDGDAAGPT